MTPQEARLRAVSSIGCDPVVAVPNAGLEEALRFVCKIVGTKGDLTLAQFGYCRLFCHMPSSLKWAFCCCQPVCFVWLAVIVRGEAKYHLMVPHVTNLLIKSLPGAQKSCLREVVLVARTLAPGIPCS